MALLRLFASAREAAGTDREELPASCVGELLDLARARYGEAFSVVLEHSGVWVNGEPADRSTLLAADDVVAVLPPVSGGAVGVGDGSRPAPQEHGPGRRARPAPSSPSSLFAVPPLRGPHIRLGIAWAGATVVAAFAGRPVLAVWFAAVAAVAAAELVRVWQARGKGPVAVGAVVCAAGLPLAALSGVPAMLAVVASSGMVSLGLPGEGSAPQRTLRTLILGVPVGVAAAAPVLVGRLGLVEPLALLALAWSHDIGAFVVGTGAASAWEGVAASVVSVIPVTLLAAVVLVPKFPESAPFVLGGLAAVLAPLGPPVASLLLGDRRMAAPAVRRLDSLLVLGPVWACVASVLVR